MKFKSTIDFIKDLYPNQDFIPLHEPRFLGNEKKYLMETIDSTFVSSVGQFVNEFEKKMTQITGSKYAVAVVNGTSALHLSLLLAGVRSNDLVITQPLTFVATCNAISYVNADPAFIDVDEENMGMSPTALKHFLENVELQDDIPIHKPTGKRVGACVPMHSYGFPCKIDEIVLLCNEYRIPVVEDSAESLGSIFKGKQTGTYGLLGVYSFNGNKTITCGGGGIIVTDNEELAKKAKHLSTQAKVSSNWEFIHDEVGYNYRCTNLNAALACAQLEQLEKFIENKRQTAQYYFDFFKDIDDIHFIEEPVDSRSNYWLNTIKFQSVEERDLFLEESNSSGVMTRPAWKLMHKLNMFANAYIEDVTNAEKLENTIVNIPSSVRIQ